MKKTMRYVLAAAVAAAVTVPLVADVVKNAGKNNGAAVQAADQQPAAQPQPTAPVADAAKPTTQPVDPAKVVIQVGDQQITAGQFDQIVAALGPQAQQAVLQPGVKRRLADQIVKIKLLAADAEKRKLDELPRVKQQLEMQREQVLANEDMIDNQATREYFEKNQAEFAKVRARHILIGTGTTGGKNLTDEQAKKKADEIRAKLTKGEDFAKLVTQESDDPGSKATGGEYTFGKGQMVAEFEKTAFGQKPGEISQPVKTQFGYHIIQTEDLLKPKFDDVKQEVAQKVGQSNLEKRVEELKKSANVKLDDDYFGKEPPVNPLGGLGSVPTGKATPAGATAKPVTNGK